MKDICHFHYREAMTNAVPIFDSVQDLIVRGKTETPIFCFSPHVVQDRVQISKEKFPGITA